MAIRIAGVDVINDDRELVLAKLTDINETIDDTAVDVFVYDTSKDSDGGAWRHRTQHTSWYAEASSASRDENTRSTRAEFPAVAVIVAEASKVTIYDGDDPSLPMWMVFQGGFTNFLYDDSNRDVSSLAAHNAVVSVAQNGTSGGLRIIRFLEDVVDVHLAASTARIGTNSLSLRNSEVQAYTNSGSSIINRTVNDVAMTVLPDAPTDPATGLPVPTIAVATDGGVSVITDGGDVWDITGVLGGAETRDELVDFDEDNRLWIVDRGVSGIGGVYLTGFNNVPSSDVNISTADYKYASATSGNVTTDVTLQSRITSLAKGHTLGHDGSAGTFSGVSLVDHGTDANDGMVAYTTSDYATGWMPGSIKMAALADTTAETFGDAASGATVSDPNLDGVYDGEHITNGDFATDTDWDKGTGWTISGGELVATSAAQNSSAFQTITTVVGKSYIVVADVVVSSGTLRLFVQEGGTTKTNTNNLSLGTHKVQLTWVATSTSTTIRLYSWGGGTNSGTIDNISVRLADPDRSVKGKGLAVHGSITKAPVATGADLVAYSGFSSSNYLEQPYNDDLDFGEGDFCVMGWAKRSGNLIAIVSVGDGGSDDFTVQYNNGFNAGYLGGSFTSAISYASGEWGFVCARRTGGNLYISVNGGAEQSMSDSIDWSSRWTNPQLRIGIRSPLITPWSGSLALWRISATAPTADQIAKIYDDEKVLFQPNAKATLTGSSDAVTALAHDPDTNLLHVGTSGGRSVFQGLRRVEEHTGTNSQSLAAISAVDGLVVEGK